MNIKFTKRIGFILLSIWLIGTGVIQLISLRGELSSNILAMALALLALAAGVLILIEW